MTTWDTGNVSTNITLSNGNLTATRATGNANNYANVYSTTSHSSGKYYFEVTITHASDVDTGWGMGIIIAGGILEGSGGGEFIGDQKTGTRGVNSAGVLERNSGTSFFDVNVAGLTTNPGWQQVNNPATGDVIGLAVDITNGLMWVQDWTLAGGWNVGTPGTQNPALDLGGLNVSAVTNAAIFIGASLYYASSAVAAATLNPGPSGFTGTVPSGFSSWDAAAGGTLMGAIAF